MEFTSPLPNAFMAWCLIMRRGNLPLLALPKLILRDILPKGLSEILHVCSYSFGRFKF
jgi:hypothetical protein